MSRFIRKAGQVGSFLSAGDITNGFSNSHVATSSGSFEFPPGTTIAKIIAIGGGGGGAYNYNNNCVQKSAQSSGGGGGTVISYVNVSDSKNISYTIGAGGASCGALPCCTVTGGTGGSTSVSSSKFVITACGGQGGLVSAQAGSNYPSPGGLGSASGTESCIILKGGTGVANLKSYYLGTFCACFYDFNGSLRPQGGSTYFGQGAVASSYNFDCNTTSNYVCATYGGGGVVSIASCCSCYACLPGAPGLVYIEYN